MNINLECGLPHIFKYVPIPLCDASVLISKLGEDLVRCFWMSWQVVNPPIQILLCFLGDAYNLLVQGPDASVVEGSCSAMLLAVLLQLLLTASLSTVLAIRQTLSPSAAEFWPLGFCATCLCLADSEPWGLSLPGNLGKAFSSGVSVEIWSI